MPAEGGEPAQSGGQQSRSALVSSGSADIRPADDSSWSGVPGTTWRRLLSMSLVLAAMGMSAAAAALGAVQGPTPQPHASVMSTMSTPAAHTSG